LKLNKLLKTNTERFRIFRRFRLFHAFLGQILGQRYLTLPPQNVALSKLF